MAVTRWGGPRSLSHSAARTKSSGRPRVTRASVQAMGADIDEVAGHGVVVGRLPGHVARDEVEDLAPVHKFPPAMPIDVAEHALAHQLAALDPGHRAQMDVGKVGESEHGI